MKKIAQQLAFTVMLLSPLFVCAQASVQQLERYLKQLTADNTIAVPAVVLTDAKNEKELLKILANRIMDGGEDYQFRVLDLIRMIGLKSRDQSVRNVAVLQLIARITPKSPRISGEAISGLTFFSKGDFTSEAKDSIVSYLERGMPKLEELFRLSGFLEIPSAKEKISALLKLPMTQIQKWNAQLALVRLGEESAVNFVLEKISLSTIDDSFVYSIVPGLVYSRNKRLFRELEKIIHDDSYRCRSSHPDSKSTVLCAYRVLENIAGAIEGFPIKVDDSGDLIVDNYQSALETARRWLKQNPDYKLNRTTM